MKRGLSVAYPTMLAFLIFASLSFAVTLNLVTGSEKGTYYQFGLNLKELVQSKGIELGVHPSTGSIENLYAVYQRPQTQIGIVQSDVLAFVSRVKTNPMLVHIAQKTKLVFPLYNEEIHLLGRQGVGDFDNLAGKRVAIGEEGSGTYLTARLLLEVTGIKPAELVMVGTGEALSRLKANQIDAMFYVAGFPVKLFSEGVGATDGLELVPITNKKAAEFYVHTKIPAETYPWQRSEVNTVAVKAVLVSYDFRNTDCESVGQLAQILYQNIGWLRENGHSKWKSVDLDAPLRGWEQYDCVKKYLARKEAPPPVPAPAARPSVGTNPIMEAFKELLNR